jgi:hypothetical protein
MSDGVLVLVQKTEMPKKKVFAARNLKDCLPNLPLETGKAKKDNNFFLSRQICASLNSGSGFTVSDLEPELSRTRIVYSTTRQNCL